VGVETLKVNLFGDKDKAVQLRNLLPSGLIELKRAMSWNNLTNHSIVKQLSDGSAIRLTSVFGMVTADLFSPVVVVVEAESNVKNFGDYVAISYAVGGTYDRIYRGVIKCLDGNYKLLPQFDHTTLLADYMARPYQAGAIPPQITWSRTQNKFIELYAKAYYTETPPDATIELWVCFMGTHGQLGATTMLGTWTWKLGGSWVGQVYSAFIGNLFPADGTDDIWVSVAEYWQGYHVDSDYGMRRVYRLNADLSIKANYLDYNIQTWTRQGSLSVLADTVRYPMRARVTQLGYDLVYAAEDTFAGVSRLYLCNGLNVNNKIILVTAPTSWFISSVAALPKTDAIIYVEHKWNGGVLAGESGERQCHVVSRYGVRLYSIDIPDATWVNAHSDWGLVSELRSPVVT
jgi:hypothetical protein